jgi:hypothetical protein
MWPDDIRSVLQQQPFQPFQLYLLDGNVFEIRHPEMAAVTLSTVKIVLSESNLPAPKERVVILSLSAISRLEFTVTLGNPSSN